MSRARVTMPEMEPVGLPRGGRLRQLEEPRHRVAVHPDLLADLASKAPLTQSRFAEGFFRGK